MTSATHGMHLKVTASCDITNIICRNRDYFAEVLQKQSAIKILWDAYNSLNVNRDTLIQSPKAKEMALNLEMELYGSTDYKGDLDQLVIDFSDLDSACLPCETNKFRQTNIYRDVVTSWVGKRDRYS